jgi:GNAT superfamily N-acetyltransferase
MTLVMSSRGRVPAQSVDVGPYRTGDMADVLGLLGRCSRASLYRRFHGFSDGVAWAMELEGPGDQRVACAWANGQCVGLANLARTSPTAFELGVLVEDGWQRRGIGRALVARLLEVARAEHAATVHADVLAEDTFAIRMLRRHGSLRTRIDGGVYSVDVELRDPDRSADDVG